MGKQYFVRNAYGQKGPYTLKQMKAALAERGFSADAEFRIGHDGGDPAGEDEAWQPIAALADRLSRAEAKKRAEQIERAPEIVPEETVPPAASVWDRPLSRAQQNVVLVLLLSIAGAVFWFARVDRRADMGNPCRTSADCQKRWSAMVPYTEKGSCMMIVDDDRNIQPAGYCTFTCSDSSDCAPGMRCGDAVEIGPQGAKWDGTFGKSAKVCLKR